LYWRTEALIDVRRNMAAANSINRSVRQYIPIYRYFADRFDEIRN